MGNFVLRKYKISFLIQLNFYLRDTYSSYRNLLNKRLFAKAYRSFAPLFMATSLLEESVNHFKILFSQLDIFKQSNGVHRYMQT